MKSTIIKRILASIFDRIRKQVLSKKIARIKRSSDAICNVSKAEFANYRNYWRQWASNPDDRWYWVYASINGNKDPKYVTEIDYYTKIEPVLNNRTFSEAYCDKNFYYHYIDKALLPTVYLRNIQNAFYDESYKSIVFDVPADILPPDINKLIVKKAVDSGGGRGVELFTRENSIWKNKDGHALNKEYLETMYAKNYLLQEYITQHDFYQQFNESSVNTIRLLTYRSVITNEPVPLQAVLRIGKPGSVVDNQASGGVVCGIKPDGTLNEFAVNKKGEIFRRFNDKEFSRIGKLFRYDEVVQIGLELAKKFFYHNLLGFDFCVDYQGNIKLIEVNNRNNEINFYQMTNGPLFKEYTDEVLEYCSLHKKTYCFDFEL